MYLIVGNYKRKVGVATESVDTCINPQCPGQVDMQIMYEVVTIFCIPACRTRNDRYISCNRCQYIDRAENYEKHRRQRGELGYTLPAIEQDTIV